jgi:hypothetical protein
MPDRKQRAAAQQPATRYRVICYELANGHENIIMDSTDDGFIAATGSIHDTVMDAELARAGPHELQAHLALIIANDDQLHAKHSNHQPRRKPTR